MARGVNKVIIVGTMGQDPDVKYSASGSAIANISIATNEQWKDKTTGQKQEKTEWHRVVMFNRLGEIAGEYLKKGSQVYIEGKLQTRKWQDQNGQDRYTTEIVANEMQMLGARGGSADFGGTSQGSGQASNQGVARPQANNPQQQQAPVANDNFGGFDDDIPFAPMHYMA